MRILIFILAVFFLTPLTSRAYAEQSLPPLPPPLQNLVDEGAQIRYLGNDHGLDAWMAIKSGQEQYFYVPPGGTGFLTGLLYDNDGKVVTIRQVQKLRAGGEDKLLDDLANDRKMPELSSASEQLFYDVQNANWVALGQAGAPVMYSFIDPQCPHCHMMINNMRKADLFDSGKLQLRIIPVGLSEDTSAQAAFLIAAPNAQERLFKYLDGDADSLPIKHEINQQGVQRNMMVMQSWKLDATPFSVYRAKDGSVKLVRGQPQDLDATINDLGQGK